MRVNALRALLYVGASFPGFVNAVTALLTVAVSFLNSIPFWAQVMPAFYRSAKRRPASRYMVTSG